MNWLNYYKKPHKEISPHSIEVICLYIAIFFMPMKRGASLGWIGLPWEITFFKIFVGLSIILWVTKSIFNKTPFLFNFVFGDILNIAAMLYLLTSIVSFFSAIEPGAGIKYLFRKFSIILLYFLLIKIIKDKRVLRYTIIFFVWGMAIECGAGIYELITKAPILDVKEVFKETVRESAELHNVQGKIRIQGFALDPDWHAYFVIIGMGVTMGSVFSNYIVKSKLNRFLFVILFISMMVNVLAATSRAGWLGLLISIGTFLVFAQIRRKFTILIVAVFLLGIVLIALTAFTDTLLLERLLFKTGQWSISLRGDEAKVCMAIFRSHPILGVGLGNFLNIAHRYSSTAAAYDPIINTIGYLLILSETGLVGLMAYLFILCSFLVRLIRSITLCHDPDEKILVVGLLSAFLPHIFLVVFYTVIDSEFLWFLIGITSVIYMINSEKPKVELSSFVRIITPPYPKKH